MLTLLTKLRSSKVLGQDGHHPQDGHQRITTFSTKRLLEHFQAQQETEFWCVDFTYNCFQTKNLLRIKKFFRRTNFFSQKIFLDPKFFSDLKLFSDPQIFSVQISFWIIIVNFPDCRVPPKIKGCYQINKSRISRL